MTPCAVDGCPNQANGGPYCRTHYWRRQHGRPMDAPIAPSGRKPKPRARSPKQVLLDAAIALADADTTDDGDWERCWHRLRMAAARYRLALATLHLQNKSHANHPQPRR